MEVRQIQGSNLDIGDRIGDKYEIYRILGGEGKSGMGVVYVCYDHESKEVFVLKTFQDKYLSSKEYKDAFKKETLAWVHLERHPCIVRAFLVTELNYRLYIILEYIAPDDEGRNTLTHYLGKSLSFEQALEWSIHFCRGMEYAVSRGVTPHRDIKPDNIMITREGVAKITDFGLARLRDTSGGITELEELSGNLSPGVTFLRATHGGIAAGTLPWMSPEQFEGRSNEKSDIYSFGVVLYQMADEGKLPFFSMGREGFRLAHKEDMVPRLDSPLFPIIERCLEKDPGKRFSDFGEVRGALEELYRGKTGKTPPPPPNKTELDVGELINKGNSFANLGLQDQAISEYHQALAIKPDEPNAHNNLGVALKKKGLLDEAISEYHQTLAIKPDDADAYVNLGNALYSKSLLDEAISEYRRALEIEPNLALAHSNLGGALKDKGFFDEAITECHQALAIKPDDAEAHNNLGSALKEKGLFDEAISEYHQALAINPDYAEVHNNLGGVLYRQGFKDEAMTEFQRTLAINPDYAEAHNNLGNVLFSKNLLDEAISEYRLALAINPDNAEPYCNLGFALQKKGDLVGALEAFRDFIRCAPPKYAQQVDNVRKLINEIEGE